MSTNKPLISVVIPYWNTPDSLNRCIKNVVHDPHLEVIVVDNHSDHKPVVPRAKNVSVINMPLNFGFAKACNTGLFAAQGEYVLFLNPDVAISPTQIHQLHDHLIHQGLTATSPVLLNGKGAKDPHYNQPLPTFWSVLTQYTFLHRLPWQDVWSSHTLPGGALLIKKSDLLEIGGWDEQFFIWHEDSDLSQRLTQDELPYGLAPHVQVNHIGGESFSPLSQQTRHQLFFSSLRQFAHKHFSPWEQKITALITQRFAPNLLLPADPSIKVSIIVPNMDATLLETFLDTNLSFFDFNRHELIIVTSAAEIEMFQRTYPHVIFIRLTKNHGFSQTVNTGLYRARGQYVGTVNDDVILSKKWLEKLIGVLDKSPKAGSVSPIITKKDGTIESAGITVLKQGKAHVLTDFQAAHLITSDSFNGATVVFSRQALESVGLFDERFGSYLEDIDLGLRLKRQGWQNLTIPTVTITHLGQSTSSKRPVLKAWQDVRNWWLVILKNWTLHEWVIGGTSILVERLRNVSGLLKALDK